ncbi:hypothetical protein AG1IA_00765 [Rhizoctonia solani AG-1 IA]|uniref:Uncharacterized protein n=1 Tax=Thanatephorus cucumeris (strain AG1-IA) TaxID=983506 RepID=L8X4S5_THACA|nr:hypothetical protein AG1IA_00765 [Rhizoctonia solani AG-1 IA]
MTGGGCFGQYKAGMPFIHGDPKSVSHATSTECSFPAWTLGMVSMDNINAHPADMPERQSPHCCCPILAPTASLCLYVLTITLLWVCFRDLVCNGDLLLIYEWFALVSYGSYSLSERLRFG